MKKTKQKRETADVGKSYHACFSFTEMKKKMSHDFPVTVLKMSVINICGSKSAKPELPLSSGIRASFRTLFWFHDRYLRGSGFLFV